jgi:hypothetical protein
MRTFVLALAATSLILTSACSGNSSAPPSQPGQYSVQKDSIHFDGDNYSLYWADSGNVVHRMETRNLRMVRDPDRTFLEVPQGGGDPILHLREDEPITVDGRDREGAFSSPWFPFFLGTVIGRGGFGGGGGGTVIINNPAPGENTSYSPNQATYRYPPTGTFGRGDELHGTVDSSKAQLPDYSRVPAAPYATSGKSSGTGGGVAATSKSSGGSSFATSNKSSGGVGAGSNGSLSGKSSSSPPSISSGSKGIGGARPSVGRR